jgi:hypothetical protein
MPTPGATNVAVTIANTSFLRLNEWLVASGPGSNDWVELFNSHPTLPLALNGISFEVDGMFSTFDRHSFVTPGGFIVLPFGDTADAIPLSLEKDGGTLSVLDRTGTRVDSIQFTSQQMLVSEGRFPDGASNIVVFHGVSTPGLRNQQTRSVSVKFNELLAWSVATNPTPATLPGWLELVNSGSEPIDLSNAVLSSGAGKFHFPPSAILAPGAYLLLRFDPDQSPSSEMSHELHTGLALSRHRGDLRLVSPVYGLIDTLQFGPQLRNLSIGRDQKGSWNVTLSPTPRAANAAAMELASSTTGLHMGRWYNGPGEGDWIEIMNSANTPAALHGLFLSDTPSIPGSREFALPPLSFIGAHASIIYRSDSDHNQPTVPMALNALGDLAGLFRSNGTTIAMISFGPAVPSAPRFPDADGDRLPDTWEIDHLLDPTTASGDQGASGDLDQDGRTNLQEYLAGTDPRNAASELKLWLDGSSGPSRPLTLIFKASQGIRYELLHSTPAALPRWELLKEFPAVSVPTEIEHSINQGSASAGFFQLRASRLAW